ncbi:protein DBF4 homolog A isoform X2 [Tachysurus fulvidraco]|uniref:protein DBF4 homolog A isoform X2 n=1 Tax=Tachysurus fulvidraco TaxID=1234273 RepID=UPI001FEF116C|nr:protein DBF4 homolog A isoform X2 [Tachysurus fulvidraco]
MKHQNFPKSTKTKFQDPNPDNGEHRIAAAVKKHHPVCEPVLKKPLAGRIFYLDLPCNKRSQALETDIKSLGGTVEKFFSKEIRYLVSSKPEARHVQRLVHDSPVPSPDSGLSSPHPGSRRDSHSHRGSSQGPADTVVVSRGKSLVEKVVKEKERFQLNRILANALEWGVKILYVDDVISYVEKKRSTIAKVRAASQPAKKAAKPESTDGTACQKNKSGRISRPFVKVEDSSRHYRPLYLPMANLPVCNLRSTAPCSPFLEENDKVDPGKKSKMSGGDRREKSRKDRHRGHEGKARRKGGYCECCIVKYDNLNNHLQSAQHQAFSRSEEYLIVDQVFSGLTCDFVHISPQVKRAKCSVTSPLVVPGPIVRKVGEMVEVEAVSDETPLWGSHNTDRSIRKRSRELSQSPKGELTGQHDTFQKSDSKRGSFECESSSNAALQKALHTPLCKTRQDCLSECLETIRTPLHTRLERTSQSTRHVRLSDPAGFRTTPISLGAGTSHALSEPSTVSQFQTAPKLLFDITDCTTERPFCKSGKAPDITHCEFITEEMLSSSRHTPSGVLQRKVRMLRRRRTAPSEPLCDTYGKPVESQTLGCLRNVPDSNRLSASALDLLQLFHSSDEKEEDFKGFNN